jgi:sulfur-carrier protein
MAIVTVRYWAAAKDAAGVSEQRVTADTLAAVLAAVTASDDRARLRAVIARSSFLVDGAPVGRRATDTVELRDGNVIEVLPPFAGG